ncbi:hypothetical protein HA402_000609 [Bradysia odoriphaga]|nr:hypothetical protein HA402_000609 [Bradysia odoriphaga]
MCQGRMNLAILMDGSGSIGSGDYIHAKEAAKALIGTFSNDLVDIGYVLFSGGTDVIFPLKSNLTRDQMKEKIDKSTYPDGSTRTDLGIHVGVAILGKTDNITDGKPDDVDLAVSEAAQAKLSNITIFAIGIGSDIDENILKKLASKESYVVPVASYDRLVEFIDVINSGACSVPQTPDIGTKVEKDQLSKNEKRYFKYQLPNTGITVKVENVKGNTLGYYSYSNENPSSAINDGQFTKDIFIPSVKLDNRKVKRDVKNDGSVHITMQGQEDDNVYNLDTIEGNHASGGDKLITSTLPIITMFFVFIFFS